MKHLPSVVILLGCIAAIGAAGCLATYNTINQEELQRLGGKGPIHILTVESLLYTFETFSLNDSSITGHGSMKHDGVVVPFDGTIPLARVVFIERLEISYWKAVWVVPIMGALVGTVAAVLSSQSALKISRPSGSCPHVYAFDGTTFKLEGETIGTALSKALEEQAFGVLPDLVPAGGKLTIRVSNERPETHVINSIRLLAGDAGDAAAVAFDINNVLWPVVRSIPPRSAVDRSGRNILPDIAREDGRYWKSDLARSAPPSGFRDQLDLEFARPRGASEATLVIRAINSNLMTELFRAMSAMLGDETILFYRSLEQDPQFQQDVKNWILECGLSIEVFDGHEYRRVGTMPPEADVVPFTRVVRLHGLDTLSDPIRVRLSSLTDVWRIDAAGMDYTPAHSIPLTPLAMLSATSSEGKDCTPAVSDADSSYALLLPPQHLDVAFDPAPTQRMEHPVYAFAVQGYLYEWFPSVPDAASFLIGGEPGGGGRLSTVRRLIHQKDALLPILYSTRRASGD